jgi:hypothetical protein
VAAVLQPPGRCGVTETSGRVALLRALIQVAEWVVYEGLCGLAPPAGDVLDDGGFDPLA